MRAPSPDVSQCQLEQLRVELVELAFTLEGRGRLDAADLALAVAARLGELTDAAKPISPPASGDVRMSAPCSWRE